MRDIFEYFEHNDKNFELLEIKIDKYLSSLSKNNTYFTFMQNEMLKINIKKIIKEEKYEIFGDPELMFEINMDDKFHLFFHVGVYIKSINDKEKQWKTFSWYYKTTNVSQEIINKLGEWI